jgi:hypothetical protein
MTACPRCGEHAAEGQEYCLECGARLSGGLAPPSDPGARWVLRALLAAVVAVAGTTVAIAATKSDSGAVKLTTAIGGFTTAAGQATLPAPSEGGASSVSDWPAGADGWTILLGSFPQTGGRTEANATARRARARGLRQVGILDSSQYASLHPGYWVVFSGVYGSEAEATSALERAKQVSRVAAVRHVVP